MDPTSNIDQGYKTDFKNIYTFFSSLSPLYISTLSKKYHNIKLLTNSFHRDQSMNDFKKWISHNSNKFMAWVWCDYDVTMMWVWCDYDVTMMCLYGIIYSYLRAMYHFAILVYLAFKSLFRRTWTYRLTSISGKE